MLQIFDFKILTLICSGDTKKLNLGGWGGKKQGLRSYILQMYILIFFIHPAFYTLVRYEVLRVRKLN